MKLAPVLPFLAAALLTPVAMASNVDPVFYPDQGRVVLPNLKIGNQIYYVMMRRLGATTDFRIDLQTLTVIGPTINFTPPAAADLVGSFSPIDEPGSTVTLNSNGTYSMTQAAGVDSNCSSGGAESGTYQYEPATGVFVAVATSDANASCGLSHSDNITRFKKVGTDLFLMVKEDGQQAEIKLVRK